jgi:hypothetical protein
MSKKVQSKKIDGIDFTVQQMPGMASVRFLAVMGQKIGPALSVIGRELQGVKSLKDLNEGAIGAVVAAAILNISPDDAESITRELLSLTTAIEGGRNVDVANQFDDFFQGRPALAFKVMAFSLEVNYGGFFDIVRALVSKATDKAPLSA